jgi:hypothetical protein
LRESAAPPSGAIGDETGAPRNSVTAGEADAQRALAALRSGDVRAARRALLDALRALEDVGA